MVILWIALGLAFFAIAIGLSEEVYFRGLIFRWLESCFSVKAAILLSSAFFAVIHASQAFAGEGALMIALTVLNAFLFGVVASEITALVKSLLPVIRWHAIFDFVNWISLARGMGEVAAIAIQSAILVLYGAYLWSRLSRIPARNG